MKRIALLLPLVLGFVAGPAAAQDVSYNFDQRTLVGNQFGRSDLMIGPRNDASMNAIKHASELLPMRLFAGFPASMCVGTYGNWGEQIGWNVQRCRHEPGS
jgi:hypothetical protein